MKTIAWIHAAMAAVVVAFHIAVILGAPVGHLTMGGLWSGTLPPEARLGSAISALLLSSMALVVLARAGVLAWNLPRWVIWGVVVMHLLGVFAHVMTPSAAERALWLPLILVMLVCALVVARRSQSPAR